MGVNQSIEELRYVSLYICYLQFQKSNGTKLDLHYLHLDEAQQIVEIVLQEAKVGFLCFLNKEYSIWGERS